VCAIARQIVTDRDCIRFSSSILPPYMRRSKSIETLLPILYLKGISTGDFSETLAALIGKDELDCRHPPSDRRPELVARAIHSSSTPGSD
jgi:hypothetical protein